MDDPVPRRLRTAPGSGLTSQPGHRTPTAARPPGPSPKQETRTSRRTSERRKAHGRIRCQDHITSRQLAWSLLKSGRWIEAKPGLPRQEILTRLKRGESQSSIARAFGVNKSTVSRLAKRLAPGLSEAGALSLAEIDGAWLTAQENSLKALQAIYAAYQRSDMAGADIARRDAILAEWRAIYREAQ